jgi:hypothetical protein
MGGTCRMTPNVQISLTYGFPVTGITSPLSNLVFAGERVNIRNMKRMRRIDKRLILSKSVGNIAENY